MQAERPAIPQIADVPMVDAPAGQPGDVPRIAEVPRTPPVPLLWRVAGEYSNISVFDVADHDELHTILSTLPLFPFMDVLVTPLARHPSAIERD